MIHLRMFKRFFLLLIFTMVMNAAAQTPQWGIFEESIQNTGTYGNAFSDVELNVTYTAPSGKTVDFWGFYDGGTTWKFRFMPDEIGTWTYAAAFSDGTPGKSGSFECVGSDIPGSVALDEQNNNWFGYKGGGHVFMRSFHVGDRFFAQNWPWSDRQAFMNWAQNQGYNMFSIASFFLNRQVGGRGAGWETPWLWPLDPAEYAKAEVIMDTLAARKIHVFPFAGFIGQDCDMPLGDTERLLYIKYTLARFAPYWNIMWNVAGPEPLAFPDKYDGTMGKDEINKLGAWIKDLDPFGHPVSVHNGGGGDAFLESDWLGYSTLQGGKGTNWPEMSDFLLTNQKDGAALYAQESFWPGNAFHPTDPNDLPTIRKKAYVFVMSTATVNFGDMSGNSSSGFSGNLDVNSPDIHPEMHVVVNKVWDYFETVPFYLMRANQSVVNNGYALARPGDMYLVYLPNGGSVNVDILPGTYSVTWVDAQNTIDGQVDGGETSSGQNLTSPAGGDDWLLYLVENDFSVSRNKHPQQNQIYLLKLSGSLNQSLRFKIPANMQLSANLKVNLYNMSGQKIEERIPVNNSITLKNELKSGLYTLQLILNDFKTSHTLLVYQK